MNVQRLHPSHGPLIASLIRSDPFTHITLNGLNTYANLALLPWFGLFDNQTLQAAVALLPNQMAVVAALEDTDCSQLGTALGGQQDPVTVMGRPKSARTLWEGWTPLPAQETHQTIYTNNALPVHPIANGFRRAVLDDLENIRQFSIEGAVEETGVNPAEGRPKAFETMVRRRILNEMTWVIEHNGSIVFQVHAAPVFADCCQLVGTYVPPKYRGHGYSKDGVRGFLQQMIPLSGTVVLRVTEGNEPAIRCYRSTGFTPHASFLVLNSASHP